jgi:hypothetical protein
MPVLSKSINAGKTRGSPYRMALLAASSAADDDMGLGPKVSLEGYARQAAQRSGGNATQRNGEVRKVWRGATRTWCRLFGVLASRSCHPANHRPQPSRGYSRSRGLLVSVTVHDSESARVESKRTSSRSRLIDVDLPGGEAIQGWACPSYLRIHWRKVGFSKIRNQHHTEVRRYGSSAISITQKRRYG